MKRIFVTTKMAKLKGMLNNPWQQNVKKKVEENFTSWPQIFKFTNQFQLVILDDEFTEWSRFEIDKPNEGILYHESSTQTVKASIKHAFTHIEFGKHEAGSFHDLLFEELFKGEDLGSEKADKIISILFKPVIGTDNSTTTLQEAQEALRKSYKSCVLGLIKNRNGADISMELASVRNGLQIIERYVKGKPEVKMSFSHLYSESSIEIIYRSLRENQKTLDEEIFRRN